MFFPRSHLEPFGQFRLSFLPYSPSAFPPFSLSTEWVQYRVALRATIKRPSLRQQVLKKNFLAHTARAYAGRTCKYVPSPHSPHVPFGKKRGEDAILKKKKTSPFRLLFLLFCIYSETSFSFFATGCLSENKAELHRPLQIKGSLKCRLEKLTSFFFIFQFLLLFFLGQTFALPAVLGPAGGAPGGGVPRADHAGQGRLLRLVGPDGTRLAPGRHHVEERPDGTVYCEKKERHFSIVADIFCFEKSAEQI